MKHIFIVNPGAGNLKDSLADIPKILQTVKKINDSALDYIIHRTISATEMMNFVRRTCEEETAKNPENILRFYAIGGDGTISLVLNGMFKFKNAELAIIPAGTGNDLVRNFENKKDFENIEKQINGTTKKIDAIYYEMNGENVPGNFPESGYALNMINIGFDADVVHRMDNYRKKPFIGGTSAYVSAVAGSLVKKLEVTLDIEVDDEKFENEECFIGGVSGGTYSGGGFAGMPWADLTDGKLDVLLIKSMSRRFFVSLVGKYRAGNYIDDPRMEGRFKHFKCSSASFRSAKNFPVAVDGEPLLAGDIKVKVVPASVNLVIPQ